MRHQRLIHLLLIACITVPSALCQSPGYVNQNNETGAPAHASILDYDIDAVNLANGGLTIRIPLMARKIRGGEYAAFYQYNSKFWVVDRVIIPFPPSSQYWWRMDGNAEWKFVDNRTFAIDHSEQELECHLVCEEDPMGFEHCYGNSNVVIDSGYTLTAADGTKYTFPNRRALVRITEPHPDQCSEFTAVTGSLFKRLTGSSPEADVELTVPDDLSDYSMLFRFKNGSTYDGAILKDTNGNIVGGTDAQGWRVDNLGRRLINDQGQYYSSDGQLRSYVFSNTTVNVTNPFPTTTGFMTPLPQLGPAGMLSTIHVPDSEAQYGFSYKEWWAQNPDADNPFGEVTRIDLPMGGYIKYKWATIANRDAMEYPDDGFGGLMAVDARVVVERRVSDGAGPERVWQYSYDGTSSAVYISTTVADPLGNVSIHRFRKAGNIDIGTPLEYETEIREGATQLRRLVQTTWQYEWGPTFSSGVTPTAFGEMHWNVKLGSRNSRVAQTTTTTYDAGQSVTIQSATSYGDCQAYTDWAISPFNFTDCRTNPTEISESDFDGTVVRRTVLHYLHLDDSAYSEAHIVDRVSEKQVWDERNKTGGLATLNADERYGYDTLAVIAAEGSPPAAYRTAVTGPRGNLTSVQAMVSSGIWTNPALRTSDTLGNLRYIDDPGGHRTTISYAGPTTGSDCAPNGTAFSLPVLQSNALGHRVQTTYYPCTGQVHQIADENDLRQSRPGTTYSYNAIGDVLSVSRADGGLTSIDYHSYAAPLTITATEKISATEDLVKTYIHDGLGRLSSTQLDSDPEGVTYTERTYDALSRLETITNPHRSNSAPTDGSTHYGYDVFGRVEDVTEQDNDVVHSAFSGNCTTLTDETYRQRKSCSDALGRLTSVIEPNPATGSLTSGAFLTLYSYDALGNLLSVNQHGDGSGPARNRTFAYDFLSHLLSAQNPESGTTSYTYDNDGNVLTKTDARGVHTTYSYDALHRIIGKTYIGNATSAVSYGYDDPNAWGRTLANTTGRLVTQATNGTGEVFSYDAVGRVVRDEQCNPVGLNGCVILTAEYTLNGMLKTLTYPSGRLVSSRYTAAGRLDRVRFESFAGQPVGYDYLTIPTGSSTDPSTWGYFPHGDYQKAQYGSGVVDGAAYNPRFQLWGAATYSTTGELVAYHSFNWSDASGHNNGNLWSVEDTLNPSATKYFAYDQVNRLTDAWTSGESWGNHYVLDPWGNLTKMQAYGTKPLGQWLDQSADANNRFVGSSYDAAGNLLTNELTTYQYDGENRITIVDSGVATYTYDAAGRRVAKTIGSDITDYFYFGGQPIAEYNPANSDWSDYIFANGKRIAREDSFANQIAISGDKTVEGWSTYTFIGGAGLANYTIQAGDRLFVLQWQSSGVGAGIGFSFTDGTNAYNYNVYDQNGQHWLWDGGHNQADFRNIDLTPVVGKTIIYPFLQESSAYQGSWQVQFKDIALVSADGTVHPIYNGADSVSLSVNQSGGQSASYRVWHKSNFIDPHFQTTYYHGDHLGSTRIMTAHGGWPIWQGTFLPFGAEFNPQTSTNHYKFTGKERDSETGLDYFGARYYGSTMGRWMSPDWSAYPVPLPYSDLSDPQTLNLYSFVKNNPIRSADVDGHIDWASIKAAAQRSMNYLGDELKGFGDTTVVATANLTNQIITGEAGQNILATSELLFTNPEAIGTAVQQGASEFADVNAAAANGDGRAMGQLVGNVAMLMLPGVKETRPTIPAVPPAPESVPASQFGRVTPAERSAVDALGRKNGCVDCEARSPGTKSGRWVVNHDPATKISTPGTPQVLTPQCLSCMRIQGGYIMNLIRAIARGASGK